MPASRFVESVGANINFWQGRANDLGRDMSCALYADRDNILRAVQFGLCAAETRVAATNLALQMYPLVERHGCWREWIPVLERCAEQTLEQEPETAVDVLDQLGRYQRMARNFEHALSTHWQELDLAQELGDAAKTAQAQLNLSQVTWRLRQYDEAEQHARAALDAFSAKLGNAEQIGAVMTILGLVAYGRGETDAALDYLTRSVETNRALGHIALLARSLMNLALAEEAANLDESALEHYQEAQTVLGPTAYELDKVRVELALGTMYLNSGCTVEAEAAFKRADSEFLRHSGLTYYQALTANNLGNAYLEAGRLQEAETALRRSLDLWKRAGGRLMLGNTAGTLGQTLLAAGKMEEAKQFLDQALVITAHFADDRWASELHETFAAARGQIADLVSG